MFVVLMFVVNGGCWSFAGGQLGYIDIIDLDKCSLKGPNPGFLFLTRALSRHSYGLEKNLSFLLNLFKSEFVERTHLYNYVFH